MKKIKEIKIVNQDESTEIADIGADAVNIDYNNTTVKDELDKLNTVDNALELKLNKKPYYYTNVASMKADTKLKAGDMAITLGYYEVNDGGRAEYKIVQSSNKYVETLNNNLKAELIIKEEANVKQFGAYGDGIHDDSDAIQTAINYGSIINFYNNSCIYKLTKRITLHSNLILKGNKATLKWTARNYGELILFSQCNDIYIYDIIFDNNLVGGYLLSCNEATTNYTKNLYISGIEHHVDADATGTPIRGIYLGNVLNCHIENCIFENLKENEDTANAITIWSDQAQQTNSKYITIRNNKIKGYKNGIKSYGTGSSGTGNRQIFTIDNNIIESTIDTAIDCYHAPGSKIINNYILGCGKGIWSDSGNSIDLDGVFTSDKYSNQVIGNTVINTSVGIWTEEATNCLISNNNITNSSVAGIILSGGTNYGKVSNNQLRGCQDGIVVNTNYSPNHYYILGAVIENNNITNSKRHGIYIQNAKRKVIVKNNYLKFWGLQDDEEHTLASSGCRIESCPAVLFYYNLFDNTVDYSKDETQGLPFACISLANTNQLDWLGCEGNDFQMASSICPYDVHLNNHQANRRMFKNIFRDSSKFYTRTGYETSYVYFGNWNLEDKTYYKNSGSI